MVDKNQNTDEDFEAKGIVTTKFATKTVLHGTESNKKRVNMDKYVHEVIRYIAHVRNRKMSQGVFSYEVAAFYGIIEDELTTTEKAIDSVLTSLGVDVDKLDNLRTQSTDDAKEALKQGIVNPHETRKQVALFIPKSILDEVDFSRGWGNKLEEGMLNMYASAYVDRFDRLTVKNELIKYLEGSDVTHHVAKDILKGNSEKYITELPDLNSNTTTENTQNEDDDVWYKSDDIGFKDLKEKGRDIYKWQDRFSAFYNMYKHMGESSKNNKDVIRNLFDKSFEPEEGWKNTSYGNKKFTEWMSEYDVNFEGAIKTKSDVKERLEEISELIIDEYPNDDLDMMYGNVAVTDETMHLYLRHTDEGLVQQKIVSHYIGNNTENKKSINISEVEKHNIDVQYPFMNLRNMIEGISIVSKIKDDGTIKIV